MTEPDASAATTPAADPAAPNNRGPAWYLGSVPDQHQIGSLLLVPLTTDLVHADYAAVMATAEHLRWWSDSTWPTADFTVEENRQDLVWHGEEHRERVAFTYSVLDATALNDGVSRVVGCIYIRPFTSACSTRGVACPSDLLTSSDAVARGWLIDELADHRRNVAHSVLAWLTSDAWQFPGAWWQERIDDDAALPPSTTLEVAPWVFRRAG